MTRSDGEKAKPKEILLSELTCPKCGVDGEISEECTMEYVCIQDYRFGKNGPECIRTKDCDHYEQPDTAQIFCEACEEEIPVTAQDLWKPGMHPQAMLDAAWQRVQAEKSAKLAMQLPENPAK